MKRARDGFSLMELMAVMAVMALLATLGVTSYFSAIRGMNKRRAADNVHKTLVTARQRACVDAAQTQVLFFNVWSGAEKLPQNAGDDTKMLKALAPSYVVCKALGRVTFVQGDLIGDEFTPLDSLIGTARSLSEVKSSHGRMRLFNLTRGDWSDVYTKVIPDVGPEISSPLAMTGARLNQAGDMMIWCFVKASAASGGHNVPWEPGDIYGIEVTPLAALPQNVFFGGNLAPSANGGPDSRVQTIRFFPDGGAEGGSVMLTSKEPTPWSFKRFTSITVGSDGKVSPPDPWQ
ncbi:MAG: type II secretion system GspH family protein [Kiritimatiellaeota bacterium]|nr:type II secretion system GspH family protein [Kiritimatiellota bacterium]